MLAARQAAAADEQNYGFEVKWDGIRAVAFSDHGHLDAPGPQPHRLHPALPEVRGLARELGARRG